jgi:hypothetical protein
MIKNNRKMKEEVKEEKDFVNLKCSQFCTPIITIKYGTYCN